MFGPELIATMLGGMFQSIVSTLMMALLNMVFGSLFTPMTAALPGVLGGLFPGFL